MNRKDWQSYALKRGRVRNSKTGEVGNLVEWSGCCAKVFTGYGGMIGTYRPPIFAKWLKADTELESNQTPVSNT